MIHKQLLVDLDIPSLAEVLDSAALAGHLRVVSPTPWNGGGIEEAHVVRVLKHHVGKRCTLEIGVRTGDDWHFLIGKVYGKDRSDVFRAVEGIQQAGFGSRDEFSIPQPVAYLPSLQLLLQEKVEGSVANETFKKGNEKDRAETAERCALWLAQFHSRAPKVGPVSYPQDHLSSKFMQHSSRKIDRLDGPFAARAAQLLDRLKDASSLLSPVELCAGHGSYNGAQVILNEKRTVVFDWDWFDVADPARDVGRFLYALRRWALDELGSIRALDEVAEIFLRTYLAVGQRGVERNLRFFEAATCFNLAMRHLFDPGPGWSEKRERAEAMLDEGLHVLEREAA